MARKTRPPSSGKAGIKLKITRIVFAEARYPKEGADLFVDFAGQEPHTARDEGDEHADDGTGDRNLKLITRLFTLLIEHGDAAEQEKVMLRTAIPRA